MVDASGAAKLSTSANKAARKVAISAIGQSCLEKVPKCLKKVALSLALRTRHPWLRQITSRNQFGVWLAEGLTTKMNEPRIGRVECGNSDTWPSLPLPLRLSSLQPPSPTHHPYPYIPSRHQSSSAPFGKSTTKKRLELCTPLSLSIANCSQRALSLPEALDSTRLALPPP